MEVQISGQYGDIQTDDIFWPMQKKLNDYFKKYIVGEYFKSITKIAIVFRVSGKIWDFKSQGVENLRYLKKTKTLTIDLVFSQSQWLNADLNELSEMIAQGTLQCFELMIKKTEKLGELIQKESLLSDIDKAISEFMH